MKPPTIDPIFLEVAWIKLICSGLRKSFTATPSVAISEVALNVAARTNIIAAIIWYD
jgi:hypothetical protein